VTQLRKMMLEELQRRNYSNGTIRHHLRVVQEFARHFATAPDKLGLNELRSYQAYLLETRKLAVGTVVNHVILLRPHAQTERVSRFHSISERAGAPADDPEFG
jgi:integrase/recombinase XerD